MRGDGRIYLRGKTWWIQYSIRGVRYRRVGGETEAEAARALRTRVGTAAIGLHVTPREERVTVNALLDSLELHLELKGAKSMVSFRAHKKAVSKALGHMRALNVTTELVDRFRRRKLAEEKRPATVDRYVETLRSAFNLARKSGRIALVPYMPLFRPRNAKKEFFEAEEVRGLIASLPQPWSDAVLFGYLTGWRRGEIESLEWSEVDRNAGEIRLLDSKNGDGRVLPLVGRMVELVERRWTARQFEVDEVPALSRLVFHNRGRRLGDWRKRWTKACEDCGLVAGRYGKSYHDLRRTAVRDMVRAGVPQSIAKVVSGHRSDSIFQRYDIVNTRDQSEALQRVEDHRRVLEERERAQKGAHT